MILKKFLTPQRILALFVLVNLVVGLFIVPDYGMSIDEPPERQRSLIAQQIYSGELNQDLGQAYDAIDLKQYYGTASSVLFRLAERYLFPDTNHGQYVVSHYGYFIFFQLAVVALFLLGRFFYNKWISLAVAVLFGTQPLLFGHGFINPKDIPLLAVFTFTIVAGFWMVDRWRKDTAAPSDETADARTRRKGEAVFVSILVGLFVTLWFSYLLMDPLIRLVEYAYSHPGWLGGLFDSVTSGRSLQEYRLIVQVYFYRVFRWVVVAVPVGLAFLFRGAQKRRLFAGRVDMALLLAAAMWGFALSTRVVAFAAGGVVGIYALIRLKQKAVVPLIIYTVSAAIISYISWPYLWVRGLKGFWEALVSFSTFTHNNQVFFEGQWFSPEDLPGRYVPKLMLLQFTEPVVILTLLGFLLGLYWVARKKVDPAKFFLLTGWFVLPLIFTMMGGTSNYSNFRQYLFIIPPLFIFAGIALQQLADTLKKPLWVALFCAALLFPGVYNLVSLHPFQYIYYNEFAGGVKGAAQEYELDYWLTAYKQAVLYINTNLPNDSKVLVLGDVTRATIYARTKSNFVTSGGVPLEAYSDYDYVLLPKKFIPNYPELADYREVFGVYVDDVRLMGLLERP